jgi:hypothetical protein
LAIASSASKVSRMNGFLVSLNRSIREPER